MQAGRDSRRCLRATVSLSLSSFHLPSSFSLPPLFFLSLANIAHAPFIAVNSGIYASPNYLAYATRKGDVDGRVRERGFGCTCLEYCYPDIYFFFEDNNYLASK